MDRFEARVERAHELLAAAAAHLLQHGQQPCGGAQRQAPGGDARMPLQAALDNFETALVLAPHLRPVAFLYGVALLFCDRLEEAADQFACCASLDRDDAEPWLWRFLCIARLQGLEAARASLAAWGGYDARLCMAEVVELFKGQATFEQVMEGACGDRHSAARASFACALYFEARGEKHLALPLLTAVAELDGDGGDESLRGLARCHLSVLVGRLAKEDKAAAAVAAAAAVMRAQQRQQKQQHPQLLAQCRQPAPVAAGKGKLLGEGGEENGARPSFAVGAWDRNPSLDSTDSTASITTTESGGSLSSSGSGDSIGIGQRCCCGGADNE